VKRKAIKTRIVSNFGWTSFGEIVGKGLFFFITIYLARCLSVENYGLLTYVQTVITYLWLAAELGINMYGTREVAKRGEFDRELVNTLFTIRISGGSFTVLAFLFVIFFLKNPSLIKLAFAGGSVYIFMRSLSLDWVLRGVEDFKAVALGNIIIFLIMGILTFILVKEPHNVVKAVWIWAFSYLSGSFCYFLILNRKFNFIFQPVFNLRKILSHLKESIHFTLSGAFLSLYQYLPILLLAYTTDKYNLGLFSASYRLIFMIIFGFSLLSMSIYPIYSDTFYNQHEKFKKLHNLFLTIALIGGVSMVFIGIFFSKDIIKIIYGPKYSKSTNLFKILLIFAAVVLVRRVYGTAISAAGLQRYQVITSCLALCIEILTFLGLFKLINLPSTTSASLSLLLAEIGSLPFIILFWKLKKGAITRYVQPI